MLRFYRRQKEVEKRIEADLRDNPNEQNKTGTRKPPQRQDTIFSDAGDFDIEDLTPAQFQRREAQFVEWRKDYERRKLEDAAAITKAIKEREAEKKKREQVLEELRIQKEREDEEQKRADEIILVEAKERARKADEAAIRDKIKTEVRIELELEESRNKQFQAQKLQDLERTTRLLEESNVEPQRIMEVITALETAWPAQETALVPYVKDAAPPQEPEEDQTAMVKKPPSIWKK
jgi:hypothetical protein